MRTIKKIIIFITWTSLLQLVSCSGQNTSIEIKNSNDSIDAQMNSAFEEFKNRPIYKVLTVEIIDNTPDDKLLQTIIDNLYEKIPKDYSKEYQTVLSWSVSQQAIYFITNLDGEVNNGGFNQWYYNSSGQFAKFTPDALKLIGAIKFSELVTRANRIYRIENEKITKHQDGTIEGFSKSYEDNPLDGLDSEYYDLKEDLQGLQIEFIRKHKNDFIDNESSSG
jgi:hypothetical protein